MTASGMMEVDDSISVWIARYIIPHEAAIRRWLLRRWRNAIEVEDVIQEAYCRLSNLASVDHIANPAAYFHHTAHTVATDIMRRAGIIEFTTMTQIEWSHVIDNEPTTDRVVAACQEIERVHDLMSNLSDISRQVIELRRVEGLSRKETAERLGISENDVKNHLVRGLQKVMSAMTAQDADVEARAHGVVKGEAIG